MHRTHIFIACGAVAVVIMSVVLLALGLNGGKAGTKPAESGTAPDVSVPVITDEPVISGTEDTAPVTDPGTGDITTEPVIDPPAIVDTEDTTSEPAPESQIITLPVETLPPPPETTAPETAVPVVNPVTTVETPKDDGPGITVKIPEQTAPYSCGTPGHHCDSAETHAYILNLELDGCPYCHRHDCPSFYATDEWGNAVYDPAKCPSYDVRSDPVYYCQDCGRKCGDGQHGTGVQFVKACDCPNCGKHVESWTCHTCGE